MLMLTALRNPTVLRLWIGQILSAIGDEIYRVALMWMAVGLIGADTGYLAAGQSAALLLLSLFGGKWADRWDSLHTMIRVDLVRALIVLIPVILYYFISPSLFILVIVAITLAALGAFFDPALQASLPDLCPDKKTLQAANGVMSITARLARVAGPGIIGFFSTFIPLIHFFTLDALSFAISAFSVSRVHRLHKNRVIKRHLEVTAFSEALRSGFRLVRKSPRMGFIMVAKSVSSSAWNVGYSLGFALLVSQTAHHDVKAFSLVVASYGGGNLIGALIFANVTRRKPERLMYLGYIWLGIGFLMIGLAPSLELIMLAAAFSGVGGPMNDVAFIDLMQMRFLSRDLTKIFRVRMAAETGGTLVFMAIAPLLLKLISVHMLIELCGVLIVVSGVGGLMTLRHVEFI